MLYLDLETYNEQDISVGTYRYAETAEVLLFAYAFEDGPVKVWDRTQEPFPTDLWNWLNDDEVLLTAHNALFDRTMITHALDLPTRLERWRCTMAKAYYHAFPGSLEACGAALGPPKNKAKLADGKKLINRFCKPAPKSHKADRYDRETHPKEWAQFVQYAAMDIEAMREVDRRLPNWNWKKSDIKPNPRLPIWCSPPKTRGRVMIKPSKRGFAAIGLFRAKDAANVGGALRAAYIYDSSMVALCGTRNEAFRKGANTTATERHTPVLRVGDLMEARPLMAEVVVVELINTATPLPNFHHP